MSARVKVGGPDMRDQLFAHIRCVDEIRTAAERAGSLAELHDAIRAALVELASTLNPEACG